MTQCVGGGLTHHGWAADEGQQPVDQSLQLLNERLRRVNEDGLQTGQSGQLDALIGTRQGLQQQSEELRGNRNTADESESFIKGTIKRELLRVTHRW